MISQFILSLTILVVLHEFGHFYLLVGFRLELKNFICFLILGFPYLRRKLGTLNGE